MKRGHDQSPDGEIPGRQVNSEQTLMWRSTAKRGASVFVRCDTRLDTPIYFSSPTSHSGVFNRVWHGNRISDVALVGNLVLWFLLPTPVGLHLSFLVFGVDPVRVSWFSASVHLRPGPWRTRRPPLGVGVVFVHSRTLSVHSARCWHRTPFRSRGPPFWGLQPLSFTPGQSSCGRGVLTSPPPQQRTEKFATGNSDPARYGSSVLRLLTG